MAPHSPGKHPIKGYVLRLARSTADAYSRMRSDTRKMSQWPCGQLQSMVVHGGPCSPWQMQVQREDSGRVKTVMWQKVKASSSMRASCPRESPRRESPSGENPKGKSPRGEIPRYEAEGRESEKRESESRVREVRIREARAHAIPSALGNPWRSVQFFSLRTCKQRRDPGSVIILRVSHLPLP